MVSYGFPAASWQDPAPTRNHDGPEETGGAVGTASATVGPADGLPEGLPEVFPVPAGRPEGADVGAVVDVFDVSSGATLSTGTTASATTVSATTVGSSAAAAAATRPYLSNAGRHSTPSPKHHSPGVRPLLCLSRILSASAAGDGGPAKYARSAPSRLVSSAKQRSEGGRSRASTSEAESIARRASSGNEP